MKYDRRREETTTTTTTTTTTCKHGGRSQSENSIYSILPLHRSPPTAPSLLPALLPSTQSVRPRPSPGLVFHFSHENTVTEVAVPPSLSLSLSLSLARARERRLIISSLSRQSRKSIANEHQQPSLHCTLAWLWSSRRPFRRVCGDGEPSSTRTRKLAI